MFLPPPLKSSAAIRAASTEPMPLVSWKMPEMSLSTPTRTTPPEISAPAMSQAPNDSASAAMRIVKAFMSPPIEDFCSRVRASRGRDPHRQAFQAAQRVVVAALDLACDLDRRGLSRQRRQHDLAFEARDQLADAHVDSGAVADVTGGAAGDVV